MSETRTAYEIAMASETPPSPLRLLEQTLALWYDAGIAGATADMIRTDEMLITTWEAYCVEKGYDPQRAS